MNKVIKVGLVFVTACSIMISCNKKDNFSPNEQNSSEATEDEVKIKKSELEVLEYQIPRIDVESEIVTLMELINSEQYGNYPNVTAKFGPGETESMAAVKIDPYGPIDEFPPILPQIVCTGSGASFAKCCGDWLDANPSGCLIIRHDGNGGYTADDEGC